jgi:hypothetical protein
VTGEALGRRLLRLDALYCAAAGVIAIALFAPLAELLHTPPAIPAVAGAATLVWATVVLGLARRPAWRPPVAAVAVANGLAAAGLAVLAVVSPALAGRLLLAAVAAEVGAFAVGQVVALRR